MPGFVDAHTHLAQSFGKSLVFGEPSEIFRRIWVPLEGSMDDEAVYLSAKLAALEALRGGFTTVVDAGVRSATGLSAVARACQEAGLRCVLGAICNDGGGAPPAEAAAIVAAAEHHLGAWPVGGLIHPSLAISIPEAATDGCCAGSPGSAPRRARSSRPMRTSMWPPSSGPWWRAAAGRSRCWAIWACWARMCCWRMPRC